MLFYLVGSDFTYSGGSKASGSFSSSKKIIKNERTDEETKEVLENLLRDDVSNYMSKSCTVMFKIC